LSEKPQEKPIPSSLC